MITTLSAQEARTTKIFVIENFEIEETNLYDHVMESAEEVTSPRGRWNKVFIDSVDKDVFDDNGRLIGLDTEYILKEWLAGQNAIELGRYESEEDAQDEQFTRVYNFDFLRDDTRDTQCFDSIEEARTELKRRRIDALKEMGGAVSADQSRVYFSFDIAVTDEDGDIVLDEALEIEKEAMKIGLSGALVGTPFNDGDDKGIFFEL